MTGNSDALAIPAEQYAEHLKADLDPDPIERPPGPGHNNPPEPTLLERLAAEHAQLDLDTEALAVRANALPAVFKTDAEKATAGDVAADALALWNVGETVRVAEKAPFLKGVRDVDGHFNPRLQRLDRIKTGMLARVTAYNNAVIAEQRRVRDEAERKAREEADKLRRQAEESAAAGRAEDAFADIEDAVAIETQARASTPPVQSAADLTRLKTDSGATMSSRTVWTFEIENVDLIPLDKLRLLFKRDAIEAAIGIYVKNGGRDLAGVKIFQSANAQVSRRG